MDNKNTVTVAPAKIYLVTITSSKENVLLKKYNNLEAQE